MADLKISQLPAATTPLAGTEVLPVVQGGVTDKVSVANLTAGRAVSGASFAVTSSTPPANGMYLLTTNTLGLSTNSTMAVRIDASQNVGVNTIPGYKFDVSSSVANTARFSGPANAYLDVTDGTGTFRVQLLSNVPHAGSNTNHNFNLIANNTVRATVGTSGDISITNGNLIPSTAAKGINFTANTPAVGMTSQLLNWYEAGTWTPTVAGAAITVTSATYTRIGRMVSLAFDITWPTTSDTTNITVASFPFSAVANSGSLVLGYTDSATHRPNGAASGTGVVFFGKSGSPSTQITNADLSGRRVIASISYFTS